MRKVENFGVEITMIVVLDLVIKTVHSILSVTIVSVCVPRKIMDYTVTFL